MSAPADVRLCEITRDNLRDILRLEVAPAQAGFVASNAVSIAQAHFYPETAWFRAVYAADEPVGFVMLEDVPEKPRYTLWRFMIAAQHQGKGYGRAALEEVFAHVGTRPGAAEIFTSVVDGPGSPGPFYERLGFAFTGELDEGERVMRRALAR